MQYLFRPAFALDVIPAPKPGLPASVEARADEAIGLWLALFDIKNPKAEADFEDWHENAAKLLAAFGTGRPVHVADREKDPKIVASFNDDFDPAEPTVFLGSYANRDPFLDRPLIHVVWPDIANLVKPAVNGYALNPAFAIHANRAARLATASPDSPEDGPDIVDVVLEMARQGISRQRIKIMARAKYAPPAKIEIAQTATREDVERAVLGALEYSLCHFEGHRHAFLVQEEVEMLDEYRVIVVDGVPVAGAGCIEALSPPWHDPDDGAFDPQLEGERNSGAIRRDPELVARYVAHAVEMAADFARANRYCRHMTLDLARRGSGDILLVEMNPLDNFGLYAMDYRPVVEAISQSAGVFARSRFSA